MAQRRTLHQLHRQEDTVVVFLDRVDHHDVRMTQRRDRLGLAHEALTSLWLGDVLVRQDLERNLALELQILRQIHLAHAALAQRFDDTVMPELISGFHDGRTVVPNRATAQMIAQ